MAVAHNALNQLAGYTQRWMTETSYSTTKRTQDIVRCSECASASDERQFTTPMGEMKSESCLFNSALEDRYRSFLV